MSAAWSLAPERVSGTGLCSGAGVDAVTLFALLICMLILTGVLG
jgi:hypothetical protein